jgi:hypothetical protein
VNTRCYGPSPPPASCRPQSRVAAIAIRRFSTIGLLAVDESRQNRRPSSRDASRKCTVGLRIERFCRHVGITVSGSCPSAGLAEQFRSEDTAASPNVLTSDPGGIAARQKRRDSRDIVRFTDTLER